MKGSGYYLRAHIHFNVDGGIRLASEAVLVSCVSHPWCKVESDDVDDLLN